MATCRICGKNLRYISPTHLIAHNLTPNKYRELFGLNRNTSLSDPDVSKKLSEHQKRVKNYKKSPHYKNPELLKKLAKHGAYRSEFRKNRSDYVRKFRPDQASHCVKTRNIKKWKQNLSKSRKKFFSENPEIGKAQALHMREKASGRKSRFPCQGGDA